MGQDEAIDNNRDHRGEKERGRCRNNLASIEEF
jgi:hypothetical protein